MKITYEPFQSPQANFKNSFNSVPFPLISRVLKCLTIGMSIQYCNEKITKAPSKYSDFLNAGSTCSYNEGKGLQLEERVYHTLNNGGTMIWQESSSGTYLIQDQDGTNVALFKPSDEANGGIHNRVISRRGVKLSEEEENRDKRIPGYTNERQLFASLIDLGSTSCFPVGVVTQLSSDLFVESSEKEGYLQEWISNARGLVDFHPNPDKKYEFTGNPILDQVPLDEIQTILVKDILLHNEDRHPGNILVKLDEENIPHLVPIDMDMILPWVLNNEKRGLFTHPRAKEPLTESTLKLIQDLNPDKLYSLALKTKLPKQAAINVKALALVLKRLSQEGFSLAEIQQFVTDSQRLTRVISIANSSDSEEMFWNQFDRFLAREVSIIKSKETRHIVFGTTYVAGNEERASLSERVSDQQQTYAKTWQLEGRVVTENLLEKACEGSIDCVPYWNKVAVLRNWLNEPKDPQGKEEWYLILDDDMVVTNIGINPYKAIDLLRKGVDSSIIIVQDPVLWRNSDPNLSVNTGLIMVRKDEASRQFMEKLWSKRNAPSYSKDPVCPTLGTCKNQAVLHEQEGFARVIEENRFLLTNALTVVKPRDQYRKSEIALNTFYREGRFKRIQEHWNDHWFSYNDPESGKWKKGDWMGQTAGVPVKGILFPDDKVIKIREKYLIDLIQDVTDTEPQTALKGAIDLIQRPTDRETQAPTKQVETYESEIQRELKGIFSLDYFEQDSSFRLIKSLIRQRYEIPEILQFALKGAVDQDLYKKHQSFKLLTVLVKEGHAFSEAFPLALKGAADQDPNTRRGAFGLIRILAEKGYEIPPEAFPLALKGAADQDPDTKRKSFALLEALAEKGHGISEMIPFALKGAADQDPNTRRGAFGLIRILAEKGYEIPPEAIPLVLKAASDEDLIIRKYYTLPLIRILAEKRYEIPPEAIPLALKGAADQDPNTRRGAFGLIRILAEKGYEIPPEAIPLVLKAASDEDLIIRKYYTLPLIRILIEKGYEIPLEAIPLAVKGTSDEEEFVKKESFSLLQIFVEKGHEIPPEAIPLIFEGMSSKHFFVQQAALSLMQRLLEKGYDLPENALEALKRERFY